MQELQCDSVAKHELSEASREIVRQYWPADKPRYWVPDEASFDAIWKEMHRGVPKNPANPQGEYYKRNPLINNEHWGDYTWRYDNPATDGLPTRTGGGALQERDDHGRAKMRNPPYKPPILYPVQYGATLPFYQAKDKDPETPLWARIDLRGGATKGFAYCQVKLPWHGGGPSFGWQSLEHLLPGFKVRPRYMYVDGELVGTQLPTERNNTAVNYKLPVFERDQYLFLGASAYR